MQTNICRIALSYLQHTSPSGSGSVVKKSHWTVYFLHWAGQSSLFQRVQKERIIVQDLSLCKRPANHYPYDSVHLQSKLPTWLYSQQDPDPSVLFVNKHFLILKNKKRIICNQSCQPDRILCKNLTQRKHFLISVHIERLIILHFTQDFKIGCMRTGALLWQNLLGKVLG